MSDQKFVYTTADGVERSVELSMLHLAKTERELDVSVLEWAGRIEPQLSAAHRAWQDLSANNRQHFLLWCTDVVAVDGHKSFVTVGDGEPIAVPYRVFVEAERFFKKSFTHLTVFNTLNLRLFVVWRTAVQQVGGDFDKWLESVSDDFVCDVYSEGGDAAPKE